MCVKGLWWEKQQPRELATEINCDPVRMCRETLKPLFRFFLWFLSLDVECSPLSGVLCHALMSEDSGWRNCPCGMWLHLSVCHSKIDVTGLPYSPPNLFEPRSLTEVGAYWFCQTNWPRRTETLQLYLARAGLQVCLAFYMGAGNPVKYS